MRSMSTETAKGMISGIVKLHKALPDNESSELLDKKSFYMRRMAHAGNLAVNECKNKV